MTTMRREWFGIDRHRMDKFLLLIRKFVHHMLATLKAAKWYARCRGCLPIEAWAGREPHSL
jgi:hypothetical protein